MLKSSLIILGLVSAMPALHAQDAARRSSQSNAKAPILAEIIVTAEKRAENEQRVPISIAIISAHQLAAAGMQTNENLAAMTPGVSFESQLGYFMPRIRGIGSTADGPGIESPVATYVDGIYIAAMPAANVAFLPDVENVQILKGPQGTLWGRNATGGAISVVTKVPQQKPSGEMTLGVSNYQTKSVGAYVTGGITKDLAASLAAKGSWQGQGYGRNLATGKETDRQNYEAAARGQLLFTPDNYTKIRLTFDYSESNGSAPSLRDFPGETPLLGGTQPQSPWDTNTNVDFSAKSRSSGVALRFSQDLGPTKLVSLTGFRESVYDLIFNYTVSPTPGLLTKFYENDRQLSQELQLISNLSNSPLRWQVGAYYFNAGSEAPVNSLIIGGPLLLPTSPFYPATATDGPGEETTESFAGYGQATYSFPEGTRLTLGARYTDEKRGLTGREYVRISGGPFVPSSAPVDTRTWFDRVTYTAALAQQFTPHILGYISVNTGFRSGGYSETLLFYPPYKPETVTAYEAGLKSTLFNRRLRVNTATFYYNYNEIQVGVLTQGNIGITNGPKAEIYGEDLNISAAVTDRLSVTTALSFLHARFGTYTDAVFNTPVRTGGNATTVGNATGNALPFSPEWQYSLSGSYRIPLASGSYVTLRGNYFFSSSFFTEVDNLREQKSYNLLGATAMWHSENGRYTVGLWAKNLTNKAVLQEGSASAFGTLTAFQPPRTFGVRLGITF